MTRLRLFAAATVAACASLAAPAAAQASFTVSPSTTQAGAAADVTIHADFANDPAGGPLALRLPAGLVGNPGPFAKCTEAQFQSTGTVGGTGCPPGSQVGTATAGTALLTATGPIFNLAPQGDEPARLGIIVTGALLFSARNEASVGLRPDGGLDSTITQLQTALGQAITSLDLTLDADFMTLPTSCAPATTTIAAANNAPQSAAFTPTGCDRVPLSPSAGIAAANPQRSQPSGYTIALGVPDGGSPRQSHVRRAEVVLPEGTTLSPGVAAGLQACTADQFAAGGCPAASQIGTVSFVTPLIGTLAGRVYFGQPAGGAYPVLVAVDDHGVHLRLTGRVTLDQRTGQITTVFDDLPQVPFTSFALSFQGGDRAVLANPSTCGTKTMAATLTPWSGNEARTATASFGVSGCDGGIPFRPSLAVHADSTAAGRPSRALDITISRPDGDQELGRVETLLPPGLAGSLSGVPFCPEDAATTGACPAATRLGSVSALVGTGGAPVRLDGSVYLTGPAEGGLAGMAIVIPGRVGPVDLGTVVVRAGLLLRPSDGGVTVRTAPLPAVVGGVPVSVRSLTLRLDRPGFAVNPSGCDVRTVVANITGSLGANASVTAPFRSTDCAGLPFAPTLRASIDSRGPKGARGKPTLRTSIAIPPGQSSTRRAAVRLPKRLTLDPSAIKVVCTQAQAAADTCPARSQVGSVSASTPLLPVGFGGPVHMVEIPGQLFPGLRLSLNGLVRLRLIGTLDLDRGVTAIFDGIPDVPLSRFDLTFTGGGPLRVLGSACGGSALRLAGTLTGHNGKTVSRRSTATIRNCPATAQLALSKGTRPRLRLNVDHGRDAKRLTSVVLRLPQGVRAGHGGRIGVTRDGHHGVAARAVKRSAHAITVRLPKARTATVTLGRGVLHGRSQRCFAVRLTPVGGKRFTLHPKAARLR